MSNETQVKAVETPTATVKPELTSEALETAKANLIAFKSELKSFYATDFTDDEENAILAKRTALQNAVKTEIANCVKAEAAKIEAEKRSGAVAKVEALLTAFTLNNSTQADKTATVEAKNESNAKFTDLYNEAVNRFLGAVKTVTVKNTDGGTTVKSEGGANGKEAVETYASFRNGGMNHTEATRATAEKLGKTPNSFWAVVKEYRASIGEK